MNELALFAGAGGGILGSVLLGHRVVGAVEIDPYCREVLLRRQEEGHLPPFPIWDDVRTFDGAAWRGCVDIVSAGFPCQPFSEAGKRKGEADERNLWPETIRILNDVRPQFAFLENVPGLITSGYFGTILGDLTEAGYDAEWCVLGADDVSAPHRRKRLWILAHAHGERLERREVLPQRTGEQSFGASGVGDSKREGLEGGARQGLSGEGGQAIKSPCGSGWFPEPNVGRVANGVAFRVDRLRALGNGQVPAVVRAAWTILRGVEE